MYYNISYRYTVYLLNGGELLKPENICCFFGHRETKETPELEAFLTEVIRQLITENSVRVFLFGSKSNFDALCLKVVSSLKKQYPEIVRIFVRSHFPEISDEYEIYLLGFYDKTYFPQKIKNAGKLSYVERNREIINLSKFCIVYYDEASSAVKKSGTRLAYEYAMQKKLHIINAFLVENHGIN